ncbi:hypothetical protein D3C71_2021550 [compost metagenome]
MSDADGGDEQRGNHHSQGGGLDAVLGPGLLPIQNVQCPAHASAQGIAGANQVNARAGLANRNQQQQTNDRQADPEKIHGPS